MNFSDRLDRTISGRGRTDEEILERVVVRVRSKLESLEVDGILRFEAFREGDEVRPVLITGDAVAEHDQRIGPAAGVKSKINALSGAVADFGFGDHGGEKFRLRRGPGM